MIVQGGATNIQVCERTRKVSSSLLRSPNAEAHLPSLYLSFLNESAHTGASASAERCIVALVSSAPSHTRQDDAP